LESCSNLQRLLANMIVLNSTMSIDHHPPPAV
jgi:hypothetical protein